MQEIRRILVVEDEMLLAEALSALLLQAGFEPIGPAVTVDRALRVLQASSIDAAILDIRLIGGLSYPLAYALRQRRLPFLFLSAYRQRDLPLDLRSERLIEKPFDTAELIQALNELLMLPSFAESVRQPGAEARAVLAADKFAAS